jgi:hypothetical protein
VTWDIWIFLLQPTGPTQQALAPTVRESAATD